jgi:ADP-ribose pyrophosphatase YjhB (NUDIX family)
MDLNLKDPFMYGKEHPRVAVNAVIIQKEKVLLTLRSDKVLFPRQWCPPGGHLIPGKSWADTMMQEVEEEVGLTVLDYQLLGIYSDPSVNIIFDSKSGERIPFVSVCFLVTEFQGDVRINDECLEASWFHERSLPSPLIPCDEVKVRDGFEFQGKCFVR